MKPEEFAKSRIPATYVEATVLGSEPLPLLEFIPLAVSWLPRDQPERPIPLRKNSTFAREVLAKASVKSRGKTDVESPPLASQHVDKALRLRQSGSRAEDHDYACMMIPAVAERRSSISRVALF